MKLDSRFYDRIDRFDARFVQGVPRLLGCEKLTIEGDVYFGGNVTIRGSVTIRNTGSHPATIPDGTVIEHDLEL